MKKDVAVVACGVMTAFGNLDATWSGLVENRTALTGVKIGGAKLWPLGVVPGLVDAFGSHQRLDALLERLLDDLPDIPADTALIVATTKGAVDELLHHPKKPA
ncbi:MAG: beta-ketoacyl synthase, partial [Proteobacteria bacterium]|nr:beta-ketoacyl synthase [Pseudomonadota bacterium]